LLVIDLDLAAGEFAEQDPVTDPHVERDALALFNLAGPDGHYFALMRFFFRRIGDYDPALRGFFLFQPAYEDAVMQRSNIHSHFLRPPFDLFQNLSTQPVVTTPDLRPKTFLVLLPRHFQVVRLLFLACGFAIRALLLVKFHGFCNGEVGLCIGPLRRQHQPQDIAERRTDKIDGILRILPRHDGPLLRFISRVRRRADLRRYNCGRTVLRRNGLHHVPLSESFRERWIVSHRNLVELAIVEREENLFDAVRSEGCFGNVRRPPSHFLNQRWTVVYYLYIGHPLFRALQHFGQAHSEREVPILGKILCTKQWRKKKQNNKAENRTAHRFHFHISYELLRT